jgi:hypothetical protein
MNRYSLLFAAIMVASLAVPSSQSGERTPANAAQESKLGTLPAVSRNLPEAERFINEFLYSPAPNQSSKAVLKRKKQAKPIHIQILLATMPHPIETHLAAEFDHNIDALEDGLQDSGFLFDSAWIPWKVHSPRGSFNDDQQEKKAQEDEDKLPGILLFRKADAADDAYDYGLLVFVISEKPTWGIALEQVASLQQIMKDEHLHFASTVRILGPTFSGSFPSLVWMVNELADKRHRLTDFLIRSGGATVAKYANAAAFQIAKNGATVNVGSAQYDGQVWINAAVGTLKRMGIKEGQIAELSESESLFGDRYQTEISADDPKDSSLQQSIWQIFFPRDISSLRSDYEKQGIFDLYSVQEPWRRSLALKSEGASEGDTVRSFGGPDTDAAEESIMIAISEFIKAHHIRAVLVSATNEEDRYFITQFIHSRNGGVRVAIMGASRLFMRGSTAQFRGDLLIDSFPMLPSLIDWTAKSECEVGPLNTTARLFPDQSSEGTYFAALDLMMQPECPHSAPDTYPWMPEYSAPDWTKNNTAPAALRPPIYVAALGSNSAWPLAENDTETPSSAGDATGTNPMDPADCADCKWQVHMPFTLFGYGSAHGRGNPPHDPRPSSVLHVYSAWSALLLVLVAITAGYCYCFWFADPARHSLCASFAPIPDWRYWLCKVIVPGAVFASAFQVMALGADLSIAASPGTFRWWLGAELLTVVAPFAIAVCALWSAKRRQTTEGPAKVKFLPHMVWGILCFAPFAASVPICIALHYWRATDSSSILNTYREMHWDSGLSLIPTALIFLLALLTWTYQAGQGLAILGVAPPLPVVDHNQKITEERSKYMARLGRPLTGTEDTGGLWTIWGLAVAVLFFVLVGFQQFREITTLEARSTTIVLLSVGGAITGLILLDLLQFVWLWSRLKGVLRSLSRESFMRSFVPVDDFSFRAVWSFSGVSLRDRRYIEGLQTNLVMDLAATHEFDSLAEPAKKLNLMQENCKKVPLKVGPKEYKKDREEFCASMAKIGKTVYEWVNDPKNPEFDSTSGEQNRTIMVCQCKETEDRFADDRAKVARLNQSRHDAEKFLCLLYIGFIMTFVARLHSLLISVAAMFSLVALGLAIYPFAPVAPLVSAGLCLVAIIAFAFYEVFSGLDRDPIMARIVNGDERKLQWSFYGKFAEAMAFPLLTLASTLLPGGAARLLDVVRVLVSRGQ